MAGRYAFSMPSPQQRDGWFRIGEIDITTTVLITALSVASMFLYAVSPDAVYNGVFVPELVRQGEVWRLITWPLVNPPDFWMIIGLLFFWYFGRFVEDDMGRKPYTVFTVVITVLPAVIVTLINSANATDVTNATRWTTSTFSVDLLGLAALSIFVTNRPGARFMFNIPGWVFAVVAVALRALNAIGMRQWATLLMLVLVVGLALFAARQRGLCDDLTFIPRFKVFADPVSRHGRPPSRRNRRTRGSGRPKRGQVVEGPWQGTSRSAPPPPAPSGGLSPLEQAELDTLLDLISANGIDSLSKEERTRLTELSKRIKGS